MPTPSVTPFLWFNNQAEQAMKFYCSIFKDSKIIDSSTFRINGQEFIAFNGGPYFKFTPAISLFVEVKTQKEVDYYWERLSKGGKKGRCGWLTDRFGLSWQVIPTTLGKLLQDPDEAKAGRVHEAMMGMSKIEIAELIRAAEQDLPPGLGKPAERALANAGISRLKDLTQFSEAELLKLHGFGPRAIKMLRPAMKASGLKWRKS
jgi:predicted 3-demethylubiquinone-9 3-methyltransferase (glyoxalase superfamily)